MKNKFSSLFLVVCMIFLTCTSTVFAAGSEATTIPSDEVIAWSSAPSINLVANNDADGGQHDFNVVAGAGPTERTGRLVDGKISKDDNTGSCGLYEIRDRVTVNPCSVWNSYPEPPAMISFDFGKEYTFSGIRSYNGIWRPYINDTTKTEEARNALYTAFSIRKAYAEVSSDGENWLALDTQNYTGTERYAEVSCMVNGAKSNITARYMRFYPLANTNYQSIYIEEIALTQSDSALATKTPSAILNEQAQGEIAPLLASARQYINNLPIADKSALLARLDSLTDATAVNSLLDEADNQFTHENMTLAYEKSIDATGIEVIADCISGEISSDTNVLTIADSALTVSGIGRAVIKKNDIYTLVKTTKAPIALVMISGQSNAAGDSSDYTQSVNATGAYKNRFLVTNSMNCSLATANVTLADAKITAENGGKSSYAASGSAWENWSAAAANQMGAKLSDEWNMKVWVVNTGICAQVIEKFDPNNKDYTYTASVNYMNAAKKALTDDGHYVLDTSKTGLFWLQGESNGIGRGEHELTATEYRTMFMNMYNGWKSDIGLNYCGIWLVRAGVNSNQDYDYYMSGPRIAQIYMGNSNASSYNDIYLILNTDIWRTNAGVSSYFSTKYPDANAFSSYYGYSRPTSLSEIKPGLHHSQKGYNELGDEAAVNISLIMNGGITPDSAVLYDYYGNEVSATTGFSIQKDESAVAVPVVTSDDFNASAGLTVRIADTSIATYDAEEMNINGVSKGATTASLYCGSTLLATYPVTVTEPQSHNAIILSDRSSWTMSASSSQSGTSPSQLTDGNFGTSWKAEFAKMLPDNISHFEALLPEKATISGFSFQPYTDAHGYPLSYEIYASDTPDGEYTKIFSGTFTDADATAKTPQSVSFGFNVDVRKVKFVFLAAKYNYSTMAEFYLTDQNSAYENLPLDKFPIINRSAWTITSSSNEPSRNSNPQNLVDGNTGTSWITQYTPSKIVPPHYIEITLPESSSFSGFAFDPYTDINGYPLTYDFYTADSDSSEYVLINSGTFANELVGRSVDFGFNINAKKVKFVIKTAVNNYGAMSEFYLNLPVSTYSDKTGASITVERLISGIGTVTHATECNAKITAAEAAYQALSASDAELVSNHNVLTLARSTYDTSHSEHTGNTNPTNCTEDTICSVCGETIHATGHQYVVSEGKYVCSECGDTIFSLELKLTPDSGIYDDDNTGIIRFVTEFSKITGNPQIESYGTYIIPLSKFEPNGFSTAPCISFTATPTQGDKYAVDLTDIPAANHDTSVIAVSFVKLTGIDEYFYFYYTDNNASVNRVHSDIKHLKRNK